MHNNCVNNTFSLTMPDVPQLSDPDVAAHAKAEQMTGMQSPYAKSDQSFLEKAAGVISGD